MTVRSTRIGRGVLFGLVGLSGLVVNQLVFLGGFGVGLHYLAAAVIATQCSSSWNFALSERFVFDGGGGHRLSRYVRFLGVNNAAFLLRGPLLFLLTSVAGIHPAISNVVSLGMLTAARFVIADSWIWPAGRLLDPATEAPTGRG